MITINRKPQGFSSQVFDTGAVLGAMEHSLAMIELDMNGTVLWVNDLFAKAVGYDKTQMPGMKHKQLCTSEFVNSPKYEQFWDKLRSGQAIQEKIQRVSRQGQLLWFEATYTPVIGEDGNVVGVIKVATDITQRENSASHLAARLRQMSDQLMERAEVGSSRSAEIAGVIMQIVEEAESSVQALKQLEKQAETVRGVVSTIREIASQTQLLALNAAIEAAHAGEFGRGFNVVAQEVRKLAGQAQEATREINASLQGMTLQVADVAKVTQSSQALISDSRRKVNLAVEAFSDIDEAARQLDERAKELAVLF